MQSFLYPVWPTCRAGFRPICFVAVFFIFYLF